MRIRYAPRAFADREAIFDYLEERTPQSARTVERAIENSLRRLELFPFSAPATNEPGIRELIVPRLPYKVYYRVVGEEVWIVHIRHAARRPWLREGD